MKPLEFIKNHLVWKLGCPATHGDLIDLLVEYDKQKEPEQIPVNVSVNKPLFEVNINWHPDYNYNPSWHEYQLIDYMEAYSLSVDAINEMMKAGAIRLKVC